MPLVESAHSGIHLVRKVRNTFLDLVYPHDCIVCGAPLARAGGAFCSRCLSKMPRIDAEQCPRCGDALGPHAEGRKACPSCRDRTGLVFRAATGACRYESAARDVVHRFKYSRDLRALGWMQAEMARKLRQAEWLGKVDVVVPVPLHWRRHLFRRFNQSELIARRLAREFGKHFLGRVLRRRRGTKPQSLLDHHEREQNVRGAFEVARRERIAGRVLLLVDDVMTTCATAAECARSLVKGGARDVYVAVFAR